MSTSINCKTTKGYYCGVNNKPEICPNFYFCPGDGTKKLCRDFNDSGKRLFCNLSGLSEEKLCPAGFSCSSHYSIVPCKEGLLCPPGTETNKERECSSCNYKTKDGRTISYVGAFSLPGTYLKDENTVERCPVGVFCPNFNTVINSNLKDRILNSGIPAIQEFKRVMDYENSVTNNEHRFKNYFTNPTSCSQGQYCPEGSTTSLCPAGFYCPSFSEKKYCPAGYYCPQNSASGLACPNGTQSNQGSVSCTYIRNKRPYQECTSSDQCVAGSCCSKSWDEWYTG